MLQHHTHKHTRAYIHTMRGLCRACRGEGEPGSPSLSRCKQARSSAMVVCCWRQCDCNKSCSSSRINLAQNGFRGLCKVKHLAVGFHGYTWHHKKCRVVTFQSCDCEAKLTCLSSTPDTGSCRWRVRSTLCRCSRASVLLRDDVCHCELTMASSLEDCVRYHKQEQQHEAHQRGLQGEGERAKLLC